eukprot:2353555-Rhodomonas_salina.5
MTQTVRSLRLVSSSRSSCYSDFKHGSRVVIAPSRSRAARSEDCAHHDVRVPGVAWLTSHFLCRDGNMSGSVTLPAQAWGGGDWKYRQQPCPPTCIFVPCHCEIILEYVPFLPGMRGACNWFSPCVE